MKIILSISFLIAFGLNAQLLDKIGLDTMPIYKSMEKALRNPDDVYRLDLSKQKLTELPAELEKLTNLNELVLKKNKLIALDESITKLKYLQRLDISKNEFEVFPAQICRLVELRDLIISQNMIVGFPACIGNLRHLEYLDAYSNELSVFPAEMKQMINLKNMDLRVISISDEDQARVHGYLPKTKIRFSNSCDCGF